MRGGGVGGRESLGITLGKRGNNGMSAQSLGDVHLEQLLSSTTFQSREISAGFFFFSFCFFF